jgi:hypothetical protein
LRRRHSLVQGQNHQAKYPEDHVKRLGRSKQVQVLNHQHKLKQQA